MVIYLIGGVVALLLCVLICSSYVKAPPSQGYVISGINKEPRVLIGKGGFRVPGLERLDKVYLGQISIDLKTEEDVPTLDFINIALDASVKVRIIQTNEGIRLAAKNFLNMGPREIAEQLKDTLQGNMREIVGTMDLKPLNTDREGFSKRVADSASKDMENLGVEILTFNVQSITDKDGLIRDLGQENLSRIKKDAAINKANAERDISIQTSKAKREANDARVEAETAIAIKNNELEIQQADLKKQSDIKKAESDAAYDIQMQEQQKTLNTVTVEAEIEKTKQEQVLSKERIAIKENELSATVNKQAEADKYKMEQLAAAQLEQKKRQAEAEYYEVQQKALAQKAEAEAKKYTAEQEAAAIEAKGKAEASAISAKGKAEAESIQAKGEAEAEAMLKKADAYKKYNNAAVAQMVIEKLPEITASISQSISGIKDISIYGGGIDSVSGNVPIILKQVMDTVGNATGVDIADIIKANTIQAHTDKNLRVEGSLEGK